MKRLVLLVVATLIPSLLPAQTGKGPYLLLGVLNRLEGHDFEFGCRGGAPLAMASGPPGPVCVVHLEHPIQ